MMIINIILILIWETLYTAIIPPHTTQDIFDANQQNCFSIITFNSNEIIKL